MEQKKWTIRNMFMAGNVDNIWHIIYFSIAKKQRLGLFETNNFYYKLTYTQSANLFWIKVVFSKAKIGCIIYSISWNLNNPKQLLTSIQYSALF